jgi:hypothetical protein
VTYAKVKKMLDSGLSPEEVASVWNSGKPDAYLQGSVGVNKYGVKYDVPGYVAKFKKYLTGESSGSSGGTVGSGGMLARKPQAPKSQIAMAPQSSIQQAKQATLPELLKQAKGGQAKGARLAVAPRVSGAPVAPVTPTTA